MKKLQWNFDQNTTLFIHENESENIVSKKAAILSRGRGVNSRPQEDSREELKKCSETHPILNSAESQT